MAGGGEAGARERRYRCGHLARDDRERADQRADRDVQQHLRLAVGCARRRLLRRPVDEKRHEHHHARAIAEEDWLRRHAPDLLDRREHLLLGRIAHQHKRADGAQEAAHQTADVQPLLQKVVGEDRGHYDRDGAERRHEDRGRVRVGGEVGKLRWAHGAV